MKFSSRHILRLVLIICVTLFATGCRKNLTRENSAYIEYTWTVTPLAKGDVKVWYFHFLSDGTPVSFGGAMDSGKKAFTLIEGEPPEYLPFLKDLGGAAFFDENRYYNDGNGTEFVFMNDRTGKIMYYTSIVADTEMAVKYIHKLPAELEQLVNSSNK